MIRQIIKIDEEKCDGCGVCVTACHEGAIEIIGGKAKLVRENFCDGLGNCLPACPAGAISFENREAPAYDEEAVKQSQMAQHAKHHEFGGCPSARTAVFAPLAKAQNALPAKKEAGQASSELRQWPIQIKLVPFEANFFNGAELLIAADCAAYAYASMHSEFMRGRVTLIGCPKLDDTDYSEKLAAIIEHNDIRSVTVVKMEVPCCTGLQIMTENALKNSGKRIPHQVATISRDGRLLD